MSDHGHSSGLSVALYYSRSRAGASLPLVAMGPGSRKPEGNGTASRGGPARPRRHRLVVAVFDTVSAVAEAIQELVGAGYSTDQICILCAGAQVDGIDAVADAGPALGWLADRTVRTFAPYGHVVIASSPRMAGMAALISSSSDGEANSDALPPLVHRAELSRHLAGRAVVLIVDAGNLDRQQTCTRILMRRTRHAVQTHQVATPDD